MKMPKMDKPVIDPADEDFGAILICAVRYALGRHSYMPSLVQDFIRPLLPRLSRNTLFVMAQDIRGSSSYGDPYIDKPGWMRFLDEIQKERRERGRVTDG